MKRLIKFGSVGFVIAGAIAISGEVFAQTIPSVFIQPNAVTGISKLGVTGTPRTQVQVTFAGGVGAEKVKPMRVNACGFAVVPKASTLGSTVRFSAQTVNISGILSSGTPVTPVPECNPTTGQLSFPITAPVDQLVLKAPNDSLLIRGLNPNQISDLIHNDSTPVSRLATIGACGFGTVAIATGQTTVSVAGGAPLMLETGVPVVDVSCVNNISYISAATVTPAPQIPDSFRDGTTIWYKGDPFERFSTQFEGVPNTRSATSDRCGALVLGSPSNPVSGVVKVNGNSLNTDSLPTSARPRCLLISGSYQFESALPSPNFKLPTGQVFITEVAGLQLNGAAAGKFPDRAIVNVELAGTRTVNNQANSCGLASIRSTATATITPTTTFIKDDLPSATFNSLPEFPAPRCTRDQIYVKAN